MRLTTRLSLFFLGTTALILVGFSAALYGVATKYLHRQADERLEAALNTLVAAAEVNDGGIEWEPDGRKLSFGRRAVEGRFLWVVCDERGRRLDGSTPGDTGLTWPEITSDATHSDRPRRVEDRQKQSWRVMARRLEPPKPADLGAPNINGQAGRGEATMHEALTLDAAVSLSGVVETLRNLALTLAARSCGTWTVALLVGGRLCRRALRPVSEMAEAAHAIAGLDFDERLPAPATGDELEELGRAFNGLLERQHESHEQQRRFAGDASHQLRTPLTAMQGQVELALRQVRSVEEYRRVPAVVQGKTRHLRRIVEALLFLARADAGALLLREVAQRIGLFDALDAAIPDPRNPVFVIHDQRAMIAQRVTAIALGYEDLNDHQDLRADPVLQLAAGKPPEADLTLASPPTLCRLENRVERETLVKIAEVLVDQFIAAHPTPPGHLILDFDATDDRVHGKQEGRFFHAYYDHHCFLPLYGFCGDELLAAHLRPSNIDAAKHARAVLKLLADKLRAAWPEVKITFRGDSGFCRWRLMRWCDSRGIGYVLGLAKNPVLERAARDEIARAQRQFQQTGQPQRVFGSFSYAASTAGPPHQDSERTWTGRKGSHTTGCLTETSRTAPNGSPR